MTSVTPAPLPPAKAPAVDANAGMGGSYEVDPQSGERRLISRTQIDDAARLRRVPELQPVVVAQKE